MGGEGEGEFDVFSGGILAGGTEVADEMMKLLEEEVGISQVVDGRVCFKGGVERKMETRVGEEKGQEDIVVLIEFLETAGEGVGRGRHGGS